MRRRCRRHDASTASCTIESSPGPHVWRVPASYYAMPRLAATREEARRAGRVQGLSEGPGLRLANFVPELIGHAPRPIPYHPRGRHHRHRPPAGPWTRPAQVRACRPRKAAWRRSCSTCLTRGRGGRGRARAAHGPDPTAGRFVLAGRGWSRGATGPGGRWLPASVG